MSSPKYPITVKAFFFGDSGVGKTSLITRIISGSNNQNLEPTVGVNCVNKEFYSEELQRQVTLQLWDTAGQEQYKSTSFGPARQANIIVLVYAVNSMESFDNINTWYTDLSNIVMNNPIYYLVASKNDLVNDKVVQDSQGEELANKLNAKFVVTSAYTAENTNALLEMLKKSSSESGNAENITIKPIEKDRKKGCC